jgi:hypothetical protein
MFLLKRRQLGLRTLLKMRGNYSDRTLRRKEMLRGSHSRHSVGAGNQVLLFWGTSLKQFIYTV